MGKYKTTTGQNLYDVALHIYGSIEGVIDLLMCNPDLSLLTSLKAGYELQFSDDYIIDPDVVAFNKVNGIIPANGERNIYFRESAMPLYFEIWLSGTETYAKTYFSGTGQMEIDWGDNHPIETIQPDKKGTYLSHSFDHPQPEDRKVRIYGNFSLVDADFEELNAKAIYLLRPVRVEKLNLRNSRVDLKFINLLQNIYHIDLRNSTIGSLQSLVSCKNLMNLDLSGSKINVKTIDEYLIMLVSGYAGRRNCHIILTTQPSGQYRQPERNGSGQYEINTGMEAIWLLCNEPEWNEAGIWKFNINDKIYTHQYGQDD